MGILMYPYFGYEKKYEREREREREEKERVGLTISTWVFLEQFSEAIWSRQSLNNMRTR